MRVVTFQDQNMTESPLSTDSNVDVTAYATEMVQRMEATLTAVPVEKTDGNGLAISSGMEDLPTPPLLEPRKTITATQTVQNPGQSSSLSQLEPLLQIAEAALTEFPELQVTTTTSGEVAGSSFLQVEDNSSSTTSGPPPLPGGKTRATEMTRDIDTTVTTLGVDDFPLSTEQFPVIRSLSPKRALTLRLRITLKYSL